MLESVYLEKFKRLQDHKDLYQLCGDRLLVEILPKEELKSEGGLIIATADNYRTATKENQAILGVVLLVGEGYYDEASGKDSPLNAKVGNIVLLSGMGIRHYSTFPGVNGYVPNTIGITRDSECHLIIPDFERYESLKAVLR